MFKTVDGATAAPDRGKEYWNRKEVPSGDGAKRAGGLEVALRPALQHNGGVWFGWSGKLASSEIPEYAELVEALDSAAGRINDKHGEVSWRPIGGLIVSQAPTLFTTPMKGSVAAIRWFPMKRARQTWAEYFHQRDARELIFLVRNPKPRHRKFAQEIPYIEDASS